jgi:glycosyltransferase involved in cell wall biosynthesis
MCSKHNLINKQLLLVSCYGGQYGGGEQHLLTLAIGSRRYGWEPMMAFPPENVRFVDHCKESRVPMVPLKYAVPSGVPVLQKIAARCNNLFRAFRLIGQVRPQGIIIGLGTHTALEVVVASACFAIPTVLIYQSFPRKSWPGNIKTQLNRWAKSRNQRWIALSQDNRRWISESLSIVPDEIDVVYNGVKLSSGIDPQQKSLVRAEVRHELALDQNCLIALTVARLNFDKGYPVLIEAIEEMVGSFEGIKFVWLGDGLEEEKEILKMVQDRGLADHVIALGYREDVARFLQAADLFVFPTLHEAGQSLALTEAMTYQLPIVASRVNGIPEVLEHNVHGLLFAPNDVDDLKTKLRWALEHLSEMKNMARRAALRANDFSEESMIDNTMSILAKVVSESTL